jgi:hypothetical protein
VEREDIICGLEFGDGYEADLDVCKSRVQLRRVYGGVRTFRLLLLAALMRDVILVRFSVSCLARWALICISPAIVVVLVKYRGHKVDDVRLRTYRS